jgi:hypothetical protein
MMTEYEKTAVPEYTETRSRAVEALNWGEEMI